MRNLRLLLLASVVVTSACTADLVSDDGGAPAALSDAGRDPLPDAATRVDAGGASDAGTDAGLRDAGTSNLVGSAGCVDGDGLPEGEATLMIGGRSRRYVLRLPTGYSRDRAWPLVLALHPNGSNAGYWDGSARPIRMLAREHAIVLMAQADDGDWRGELEAELTYFEQVIGRLKGELCVDESRIFSMGFSGGGSFSGMLGCRRRDIRAIASGGAVIYFEPDACVGTPAAWITIGEGELQGRTGFRDFWRQRAECETASGPTAPNPPCVAYEGCAEGRPVHYCQHEGGHVWPDFGTQAAWSFFAGFL